MGLVIDAKKYIIGAADVYFRPVGGTGLWVSIGATVDDIVFRVKQSTFNPSDKFNGLLELIREMDYLSKASAEAEFTMPEFAGDKLKLAILGATVTTVAAADAGGGWATTLANPAAAGATSITVASAAGVTVGDIAHIGAGATSEYRVVDQIAGAVLTFRDPLRLDHAAAAAVVKATSDGKTEITPGITRRQPLTAYNDYALVAQSPSDYYELYLFNAISATDSAEIAFGNETMAAIKVTLGTRRDGLNLDAAHPSWKLRVPA
jgi:hypothetical protein